MSIAAGPDHTLQPSAGLHTQASSPRLSPSGNPVQPGTVSPVIHPAPGSPTIYPFPPFDHELTASSAQTSTSSRSDAEILEHDDELSSLSENSLLSESSLLGNTSSPSPRMSSPPRPSLQDDTVAGASALEAEAPPVLRSPFPQYPHAHATFGRPALMQPALGRIGLRQPALSQPPIMPRQTFAMPQNFQPWMPQHPGYQPPMVPGQPELPRNIQPVMPVQGLNRFSLSRGLVPKSPPSSSLPPRPTLDPARRALLRARAIRNLRNDLEAMDAKVGEMQFKAKEMGFVADRTGLKRGLFDCLDEDEDEKEEDEKSKKARQE